MKRQDLITAYRVEVGLVVVTFSLLVFTLTMEYLEHGKILLP